MTRPIVVIAMTFMTGVASAAVPVFTAKCTPGLNVDANSAGQIRMNGKVARVIKRPDGQISANSAGAWIDITPQGDQPPRVTYTARDKSVGECQVVSFKAPGGSAAAGASYAASHDAKVPGTDYHATTDVPCSMSASGPTGSCHAGVKREGNGSGTVTVTKPDGRTRTIFFKNGRATGYDQSQADSGKFSATRQGDVNVVHIGEERYEIPDMLVFGG